MSKRKTTITIRTTHGERQVAAEVYGKWAVHEQWPDANMTDGWALTHVPSGLCVPQGRVDFLTKKKVVEIAKIFDADFSDVKPCREDGKRLSEALHEIIIGVYGKPANKHTSQALRKARAR